MVTRVLADANALYSRTIRDWLILLQLASSGGMFRTYWTEDILAEACYHLRKNHPDWDGGTITRLRDKIAQSLEGGRVDDFSIDGSFPGVDRDDQHVHAAAVACDADIVLTMDQGFRATGVLDALPYEVYEPDAFFVLVDNSAPELVCEVAEQQLRYWQKQHRGVPELVEALRKAECSEFGERVEGHLSTRA